MEVLPGTGTFHLLFWDAFGLERQHVGQTHDDIHIGWARWLQERDDFRQRNDPRKFVGGQQDGGRLALQLAMQLQVVPFGQQFQRANNLAVVGKNDRRRTRRIPEDNEQVPGERQ
jgi:hypothetical protein